MYIYDIYLSLTLHRWAFVAVTGRPNYQVGIGQAEPGVICRDWIFDKSYGETLFSLNLRFASINSLLIVVHSRSYRNIGTWPPESPQICFVVGKLNTDELKNL